MKLWFRGRAFSLCLKAAIVVEPIDNCLQLHADEANESIHWEMAH